MYMSKRLQVLFPDDEYAKLKRHARAAKLSLGEWVRSALRRIRDDESARSPEDKLRALKSALSHAAPVDEVAEMERQIESGYLK